MGAGGQPAAPRFRRRAYRWRRRRGGGDADTHAPRCVRQVCPERLQADTGGRTADRGALVRAAAVASRTGLTGRWPGPWTTPRGPCRVRVRLGAQPRRGALNPPAPPAGSERRRRACRAAGPDRDAGAPAEAPPQHRRSRAECPSHSRGAHRSPRPAPDRPRRPGPRRRRLGLVAAPSHAAHSRLATDIRPAARASRAGPARRGPARPGSERAAAAPSACAPGAPCRWPVGGPAAVLFPDGAAVARVLARGAGLGRAFRDCVESGAAGVDARLRSTGGGEGRASGAAGRAGRAPSESVRVTVGGGRNGREQEGLRSKTKQGRRFRPGHCGQRLIRPSSQSLTTHDRPDPSLSQHLLEIGHAVDARTATARAPTQGIPVLAEISLTALHCSELSREIKSRRAPAGLRPANGAADSDP